MLGKIIKGKNLVIKVPKTTIDTVIICSVNVMEVILRLLSRERQQERRLLLLFFLSFS